MAERDANELASDLREHVEREVAAGFLSPAAVVQSVLDVFVDDAGPDVLEPLAERLTRKAVAAHALSERTWPDVTDCDRLDDAFAELNRGGIVCRQNFSCCGNCGVAEIGDEMQAEAEAGLKVRGYAFYHMQDTEAAVEGCGLFLNYGATDGDAVASEDVGRKIADTLTRHGLTVQWDGSLQTRIGVQLDWKRRRPHEAIV